MLRLQTLLVPIALVLYWAQPNSHAVESSRIPFEDRAGLLWISVWVNSSEKLNFLFDSGAEQSVIAQRCARKLGLQFVGTETVKRVDGEETAYQTSKVTIQFSDDIDWSGSLLALDLKSDSRRIGKRIDGLVGMDFMANRVVQINYQTKVINLAARFPSASRVGTVVPIRVYRGNPCISLRIDGVTAGRIRIDTGCDCPLRLSANWDTSDRAKARRGTSMRKSRVAIGSKVVENVATTRHAHEVFPGEHGLLGNPLLARFGIVTIDIANRRFGLGR